MRNWRTILGASKNDSENDIRRKYKKLVLKHHPNKGGRTEDFRNVQKAWEAYKRGNNGNLNRPANLKRTWTQYANIMREWKEGQKKKQRREAKVRRDQKKLKDQYPEIARNILGLSAANARNKNVVKERAAQLMMDQPEHVDFLSILFAYQFLMSKVKPFENSKSNFYRGHGPLGYNKTFPWYGTIRKNGPDILRIGKEKNKSTPRGIWTDYVFSKNRKRQNYLNNTGQEHWYWQWTPIASKEGKQIMDKYNLWSKYREGLNKIPWNFRHSGIMDTILYVHTPQTIFPCEPTRAPRTPLQIPAVLLTPQSPYLDMEPYKYILNLQPGDTKADVQIKYATLRYLIDRYRKEWSNNTFKNNKPLSQRLSMHRAFDEQQRRIHAAYRQFEIENEV